MVLTNDFSTENTDYCRRPWRLNASDNTDYQNLKASFVPLGPVGILNGFYLGLHFFRKVEQHSLYGM